MTDPTKGYAAAREAIQTARHDFPPWATERRAIYVGAQLWVCKACDMVRQWGDGAPQVITNELAFLRCIHCRRVTVHFYGGVSKGFSE